MKGLDTFREHFRGYSDQYALIGGAACDLLMENAGLTFRATKDLDIVLCLEALDAGFVAAFWAFVEAGNYETKQSATGRPNYYRFQKPGDDQYPFMLELFCRKPDILDLAEGAHLTPIPVEEDVSSLSAILLDNTYYGFVLSGKRIVGEVPVVGPEHLIPLKARAWLDLTNRKRAGAAVDGKEISKHKNDVFRLYQLVDPDAQIDIPQQVSEDMRAFLGAMASQQVDLLNLGIKGPTVASICEELRRFYAPNN